MGSYGKLCVVISRTSLSLIESMDLLSKSMVSHSTSMVMYCGPFVLLDKSVVFLKMGGVRHTSTKPQNFDKA